METQSCTHAQTDGWFNFYVERDSHTAMHAKQPARAGCCLMSTISSADLMQIKLFFEQKKWTGGQKLKKFMHYLMQKLN